MAQWYHMASGISVNNGPGNGLSSVKRQASAWTNEGLSDHREQNWVKSESK